MSTVGAVVTNWLVPLGLGAILLEVVRSILQRRKMGADAAKAITEAATTLLAPLQARVKELEPLEGEVEECRKAAAAAREELDVAMADLERTRRQLARARKDLAEVTAELNEARERLAEARLLIVRLRTKAADTPGDPAKEG